MANVNLKELKYDGKLVLVEMSRRALTAKTDNAGNVITETYATKAEIGQLKNLEPIFVNTLPATGDSKYLYFVPKDEYTSEDAYDEFIWVTSTSKYERIGSSTIDVSGKLDKVISSGIGIYAHNGATQNTLGLVTASNSTDNNTLITSAKVNELLENKQNSSTVLTSIAAQSSGTGLVKLTNGVASLDTNQYALASDLKITATDVVIDW